MPLIQKYKANLEYLNNKNIPNLPDKTIKKTRGDVVKDAIPEKKIINPIEISFNKINYGTLNVGNPDYFSVDYFYTKQNPLGFVSKFGGVGNSNSFLVKDNDIIIDTKTHNIPPVGEVIVYPKFSFKDQFGKGTNISSKFIDSSIIGNPRDPIIPDGIKKSYFGFIKDVFTRPLDRTPHKVPDISGDRANLVKGDNFKLKVTGYHKDASIFDASGKIANSYLGTFFDRDLRIKLDASKGSWNVLDISGDRANLVKGDNFKLKVTGYHKDASIFGLTTIEKEYDGIFNFNPYGLRSKLDASKGSWNVPDISGDRANLVKGDNFTLLKWSDEISKGKSSTPYLVNTLLSNRSGYHSLVFNSEDFITDGDKTIDKKFSGSFFDYKLRDLLVSEYQSWKIPVPINFPGQKRFFTINSWYIDTSIKKYINADSSPIYGVGTPSMTYDIAGKIASSVFNIVDQSYNSKLKVSSADYIPRNNIFEFERIIKYRSNNKLDSYTQQYNLKTQLLYLGKTESDIKKFYNAGSNNLSINLSNFDWNNIGTSITKLLINNAGNSITNMVQGAISVEINTHLRNKSNLEQKWNASSGLVGGLSVGDNYYRQVEDPKSSLYLFKIYKRSQETNNNTTIYFYPPTTDGARPEFAINLWGKNLGNTADLIRKITEPLAQITNMSFFETTLFGDRGNNFNRRKYGTGGSILAEIQNRLIASLFDSFRIASIGTDVWNINLLAPFSPRQETSFYNRSGMLKQILLGNTFGFRQRLLTNFGLTDADYNRPTFGSQLLKTNYLNTWGKFAQWLPQRTGNVLLDTAGFFLGNVLSINLPGYENREAAELTIQQKLTNLASELNVATLKNASYISSKDISNKDNTKPKTRISLDSIAAAAYDEMGPISIETSTSSLYHKILKFENKATKDETNFIGPIIPATEVGVNGVAGFTDDQIILGFVYPDKNLNYTKKLQFKAYLNSMDDVVASDWGSGRFLGHPLSYATYKGISSRTLNFSFNVHTMSKAETVINWTKINKLFSLCYPSYSKSRMQAPIIRLHIGSLYKGIPGYITNITNNLQTDSPWETEGSFQVPHYITITVTYVVIGHVLSELDGIDYNDVFRDDRYSYDTGSYFGKPKYLFEEYLPSHTLEHDVSTTIDTKFLPKVSRE